MCSDQHRGNVRRIPDISKNGLCLEWRNQVSGQVDVTDFSFVRVMYLHFEELKVR